MGFAVSTHILTGPALKHVDAADIYHNAGCIPINRTAMHCSASIIFCPKAIIHVSLSIPG